jgi:2-iminobutanoate/2-iminopropanoate deaminase
MRHAISSEGAPPAIGPYSHGVIASGRLLFVSGQTGKHPKTGELPGDFRAQVERCLENVKSIVEAAGASMADVVKVNAYLADLGNFAAFNEAYTRCFASPYPARTTIGAVLPGGGMQVEIDAIVALPR